MSDFLGTLTVAVIGKPNVGKSTLVNALVKEKVSIVTPKKQTTRENIMGILNEKDFQIVFVDTPGIHQTVDELGKSMMKDVRSAMNGVDIVLYVVDATKNFDKREFDNISQKAKELSVIVILSKIDIAGYEKTYPLLQNYAGIKELLLVLPISSKENKNLDVLIDELKKHLKPVKENELFYARDTYTDKSVSFMCAEIVREKCLLELGQEIPHGLFIEVVSFIEEGGLTTIDIDINCKKDSHKAIIIGRQGNKLKEIATESRRDMEELLHTKVMLNLFVKSREK